MTTPRLTTEGTCTTCGGRPEAPYRRIVAGQITEGCVDAAHDGHLVPTTNSGHWHNRPEARRIRATTEDRLRQGRVRSLAELTCGDERGQRIDDYLRRTQ